MFSPLCGVPHPEHIKVHNMALKPNRFRYTPAAGLALRSTTDSF